MVQLAVSAARLNIEGKRCRNISAPCTAVQSTLRGGLTGVQWRNAGVMEYGLSEWLPLTKWLLTAGQ